MFAGFQAAIKKGRQHVQDGLVSQRGGQNSTHTFFGDYQLPNNDMEDCC